MYIIDSSTSSRGSWYFCKNLTARFSTYFHKILYIPFGRLSVRRLALSLITPRTKENHIFTLDVNYFNSQVTNPNCQTPLIPNSANKLHNEPLPCPSYSNNLFPEDPLYRSADKSLARPTSRCISFDGVNISFDASLVIYINSTNIPAIMIINRIYETQNLLSL